MSGIRWVDVSTPMHAGMTVWPGDAPFSLTPARRIARGDACNTSALAFSTHTGTHMDAPWHFKKDGKRLDEMDPALFFGDALVLEVRDANEIRAEHFGAVSLSARVLFRTLNSDFPVDAPFDERYVALAPCAARCLVEQGVRLVGVDSLSVAPFKQEGQRTHHLLLQNDVVIVEGLRLGEIRPGVYPFVVLPLPLEGADGSPCRAFIGQGANHA